MSVIFACGGQRTSGVSSFTFHLYWRQGLFVAGCWEPWSLKTSGEPPSSISHHTTRTCSDRQAGYQFALQGIWRFILGSSSLCSKCLIFQATAPGQKKNFYQVTAQVEEDSKQRTLGEKEASDLLMWEGCHFKMAKWNVLVRPHFGREQGEHSKSKGQGAMWDATLKDILLPSLSIYII